MRSGSAAVTAAIALFLASPVSGCGGKDDDSRSEREATRADGQTATQPESTKPGKSPERSTSELEQEIDKADRDIFDAAERGDDAAMKRAEDRQRELERQLEAQEDREWEAEFKESKFDRVVGRLPIKQPPLRVQQTIQYGNSHRLWVAVRERYFLCTLSVSERRRAVADFYAESDRVFREAGVGDFALVVTRLQETGIDMPTWATAGRDGIRLTAAGRRSGC